MSKQQSFVKQRINQKRGDYTRARKKKYKLLKNTGQYLQHYQQVRGLSMKKITIKSSTGKGIPVPDKPKQSLFSKIFKRKNHAKNIL